MEAKIVQINFKYNVSSTELQAMAQSVAQVFAAVPGLRWKIWLHDEARKEAGGIYLFESELAMNNFLSSPLVEQVRSIPAFYDMSVKQFGIQEDVTAITRGPIAAMAAAR
jgi:Putative mono-oxygenase ydhR